MLILDRVEQFIERCTNDVAAGRDEDELDRLALAVFAHQYEHVHLYRRFCELRGVRPADVAHWTGIPAAPADLFKEAGLATSGGEPVATFLSSGTTQGSGRRSRHELGTRDLALYRKSALAQFRAMVLPDAPATMSTLVLAPRRATHPMSSLGHMFDFVVESISQPSANEGDVYFDSEGRLDAGGAVGWLEAAAAGTQPVLILSVSATITAVLEALRSRGTPLRLPADSRLVHTGGSKGGRTMSRAGILKGAWRFLHIPAYHCVEEYGMTELLSQFYDDVLRNRWSGRLAKRAKTGPPWTRTSVVDPATLAPAGRGERGILRHLDLANCSTVSMVQTLDLGVEQGDGFEVLGRATGADMRGCSQLMSGLAESISGHAPAALDERSGQPDGSDEGS